MTFKPLARLDGFTLLEILASMVILSVLATLTFIGYEKYQSKIAQAACMGNLKTLGTAFQLFMNDHDQKWPPHPKTSDPYSEGWENYWIKLFERGYDIPAKTWLCPVLQKNRVTSPMGRVLKVHYVPTLFDGTRNRANDLNSGGKMHPWLMEIANAHGDGALMYFPSGIVSMNQFLRDRGVPTD